MNLGDQISFFFIRLIDHSTWGNVRPRVDDELFNRIGQQFPDELRWEVSQEIQTKLK